MSPPRSPLELWRSIDRRVLDAAVAALLFLVMAAELAGDRASTPVAYLLAAAVTAPLAGHRRYPVAAVACGTTAVLAYSLGHFSAFPGYALFALTFAVSLHADRRRAGFAFAAALVALAVALSLQPAGVVTASTWISTVLALVVAWLAGENVRVRRVQLAELRERARALEQDRELRERQAVGQERLRIARELHDVVAHSMSVIAVQAGVAHHVIDSRPELARQALATVETNTRAALVEMRRLLGVLRQGDEPSASLAPAPRLTDVPALVRQFAEAGLAVELRVDGVPDGVPDGVDLSAYRIVQEGLTNVLRHGGPAAEVSIGYPGTAVVIEICDPGPPARRAPGENGPGHGLIGMRERVAVFGGRITAGPRAGGGFRVAATLPFTAAARAGAA
ncbi:sensor histidine kinase [Actinoplanes sp. L3-i22]|uniref:sensor histidine kinase n=1 Tax=Actinoplanes sp. L3-i22 TaxID=2836373 RepID=UPI001C84563D|nr:sensor histidine kinase [Actinoplanes sp. L3-i22]